MTAIQLNQLKQDFTTVRSIFNQLSSTQKQEAEVVKWEGYLVVKEKVADGGNTKAPTDGSVTVDQFLKSAQALPNVSAIKQMTGSQLTTIQAKAKAARSLFNDLSLADKQLSIVKSMCQDFLGNFNFKK